MEKVIDLLEELKEYMENKVDVDWDGYSERFFTNEEGRLLSEIDEAITKLKKYQLAH